MKAAGLVLAALCLTGCVPWTVVPIEEEIAEQAGPFDAVAYVDSIWDQRLLPALEGKDGAASGTAVVLRVDTKSRSGKMFVDSVPGDGEADAVILIGPVILGTALRDGAGFIEFSEFTNQLDYADVANELNRRVVEEVVGGVALEGVVGKRVRYLGVASPPVDGLREIVPVRLEVE